MLRFDVIGKIEQEVERARAKHGMSIEGYDNGLRLAVMTEEIGEVARAMCEHRLAEEKRDKVSRTGTTDELEAARREVERWRNQIYAEVVQVAACAARWLETQG